MGQLIKWFCVGLAFLCCPISSYAHETQTAGQELSAIKDKESVECLPFSGSETVGSLQGVVFFGEWHGTNEIPEYFGRVVCVAGKSKRKVHVALELREDWTDALSSFINQHGDPGAVDKFFQGSQWGQVASANPDGRTSRAVFDLLMYFRRLNKVGYQISVSAFDTRPWQTRKVGSDVGMAAILTRNIEKTTADVTFVLSGEYHTRLIENTTPAMPRPLAFLVAEARPKWKVAAIVASHSGGTMWGCTSTGCGNISLSERNQGMKPGLVINQERDQFGYMGVLHVGSISASAPFLYDRK